MSDDNDKLAQLLQQSLQNLRVSKSSFDTLVPPTSAVRVVAIRSRPFSTKTAGTRCAAAGAARRRRSSGRMNENTSSTPSRATQNE